MDLFRETIEIFKERKFIRADSILPTYVCSIGCHMFNFMNKHKRVYTDGDIIPDMRLHIFMVTIPGFGKTYLINQFMSKYNGMLMDTDVKTSKIGSLTSSGLVGSIKTTQDGTTVINKGVLQRKANYILGSDEFSNVTTSSKTSHSLNLINDLLTALDDGLMTKDQSGGGLEYETFATVWGATQPGRFELKAGLPRRFVFVIYMPNVQDIYKFRAARRESKDLKLNLNRLLEYKLAINARLQEVNENLKEIVFPKEFFDWINTFFAMHYEDMLYERILLGYWIMKSQKIGERLVLELNDEVKEIIRTQVDARLQAQRGVQKIKIMEVIKYIKKMKYSELLKLLLSFSLEEKYITRDLDALIANHFISVEGGIVTNLKYEEV